jgi:hypothetical protein
MPRKRTGEPPELTLLTILFIFALVQLGYLGWLAIEGVANLMRLHP